MDDRRIDERPRTEWVWNPELRDAYSAAMAVALAEPLRPPRDESQAPDTTSSRS